MWTRTKIISCLTLVGAFIDDRKFDLTVYTNKRARFLSYAYRGWGGVGVGVWRGDLLRVPSEILATFGDRPSYHRALLGTHRHDILWKVWIGISVFEYDNWKTITGIIYTFTTSIMCIFAHCDPSICYCFAKNAPASPRLPVQKVPLESWFLGYAIVSSHMTYWNNMHQYHYWGAGRIGIDKHRNTA